MPILLVAAALAAPVSALHAQVPLGPQAQPAAPPPPVEAPVTSPPPDRIQVQELASVNPNETGLIDEAHGALGSGLWSGTLAGPDRTRPADAAQPAGMAQLCAALELRLLESPASLPAGKQDGEPVLGLARRQAGGDGRFRRRGAAAVAHAQPANERDPAPSADRRRPAGRRQCRRLRQEPALRAALPGDNYAQEVQIFCQFSPARAMRRRSASICCAIRS